MNTIGKIIQDRRKELKLRQPDITKQLEQFGYFINPAAVSSWERNVTQPNATQLLALCKILGITNIYDTFIGEYTPDDPFSELNEEGIKKAKEYIALLVKSGDYAREDRSVLPSCREIRLYDLPASAGTGAFLDSDNYERSRLEMKLPRKLISESAFRVTAWSRSISTVRLYGCSRRKKLLPARSASFIWTEMPIAKN